MVSAVGAVGALGVVRVRKGVSKVGCLFVVLVLAATVYFGEKVGHAVWNYYIYRDRMVTEARFASHRTDAAIKRRIAAFADSLGLPESARNVIVRRGPNSIFIFAEYYEHIELPGFVREFHFTPSATGSF